MTSFAQIAALVDAHTKRDHDRFRAVTLQIAAHQRSPGSADHLRKLVDRQQASSLVPLPSANGLLSTPNELPSFDDMVLAPAIRDRLDRVVLESARRDDLLARGLRPARKLLFTGVPGVGKSMSAAALARAVGLPMFRVELHSVISQYLGETASKLAKVFDHVRQMPGVYLFDEFDALGAARTAAGDTAGGEMRRVVNSLLQFIEDDRSEGLIVAATNHAQVLDPALFRRFDETIAFQPLAPDELVELTRRKLGGYDISSMLDFDAIYAAIPDLGHADLCAVLDRTCKDHVLMGSAIDTKRIVTGIVERMCLRRSAS